MQTYLILKSFKGSQNGIDSHEFVEGSEARLSDDLAKAVLAEGWVEAVDGGSHAPASRETKVITPNETKPLDLASLKSKELTALAKERGIKLKFGMKKEEILAALQAV